MAFGYTRALPTITGSHSDFPVLLDAATFPTAAVDGGASSVDNGGGNLRAYTDDTKTTQLSLDVVTFVTGVSPEVEVWVKIPTAATSETIYLESDSVATAQPAVGAAFGRNSVWSDFILTMHMESASPVDSTGNNTSITANAVSTITGKIGGALDFNGSTSDIDLGAAILPVGDFTQSAWVNPDVLSGFQGIIGNWVSGDTGRTYVGTNGTSANWDGYSEGGNARGALSTSVYQMVAVTRTGTTATIYINGVAQGATINDFGTPNADHNTFIGALSQGTSNFFNGAIDEVRLSNNNSSADRLLAEFNNQNSPSTWGTSGSWADSGGGNTLAADSGAYTYTGTSVNLIRAKILTADSGNYTYTGTSVSLLKGSVLNADTGAYAYTGTDVTLTYTPAGSFVLTADSGLYTYTGSDINFNRNRVIIASSGNYSYSGTDIQFLLPGQVWTDKPSVSTNWTNKTQVTTIWTDK